MTKLSAATRKLVKIHGSDDLQKFLGYIDDDEAIYVYADIRKARGVDAIRVTLPYGQADYDVEYHVHGRTIEFSPENAHCPYTVCGRRGGVFETLRDAVDFVARRAIATLTPAGRQVLEDLSR